MPVMLKRWNDDKMDALDAKVDRIDRELGDLRQDFREFRKELHEDVKDMNKGFDAFSRTMTQVTLGMAAGFVVGWGALVGLIATQL
jgi:hypothetical protein